MRKAITRKAITRNAINETSPKIEKTTKEKFATLPNETACRMFEVIENIAQVKEGRLG